MDEIRKESGIKINKIITESILLEKKLKEKELELLEESNKITAKMMQLCNATGHENIDELTGFGIEMVKVGLSECCSAISNYQTFMNSVKVRTHCTTQQLRNLIDF